MEIELPNEPFLTNDSQLREIVLKITDIISVDRIYFFHFEYKKNNFSELIILIPSSAKQHLTEARPLAKMVLSRYPDFKFRMFYLHEVKEAIKQGSMVLFNICKPNNLIYRQAEGSFDMIIDKLDYQTVQNSAIVKIHKELKKIADFREGAAFYLDRKNYPLTALMLHQSIELSYRAAEIMIVGKERTSHCIRNHQKYLSHYAQEFSLVFDEKKEEDMILLDLLNDAYSAVRYKNTYQITADQLDLFIKKADKMDLLIAELYELITEHFTQTFQIIKKSSLPESNDKEKPTAENLRTALLSIEKIIKEVLPESIKT